MSCPHPPIEKFSAHELIRGLKMAQILFFVDDAVPNTCNGVNFFILSIIGSLIQLY